MSQKSINRNTATTTTSRIPFDEEDEFEWDESKKTKTTWSMATRQRAKHRITYGGRKSNSRMIYGKQQQQESSTGFTSASNSLTSSTTTNTTQQSKSSSATSNNTQFGSQSKRSLSFNSFGEISTTFDSINEENRNPNIIHNKHNQQQHQLKHQDSFTFSSTSSFPEKSTKRDSLTFSNHSLFGSRSSSSTNYMFSSFNSLNNINDDGNNNSNNNTTTDASIFSVPCLTPSRSISSSSTSRKRGVCDSPLLPTYDDYSTHSYSSGGGGGVFSGSGLGTGGGEETGGLSGSTHTNLLSTSSFGSRRARSRIFSPESTKKLMAAAAAASSKDRQGSAIESDSNSGSGIIDVSKTKSERMMAIRKKNESFNESESEMEMDVDDHDNSFSFHNTSCELSHIDFEENEKFDDKCDDDYDDAAGTTNDKRCDKDPNKINNKDISNNNKQKKKLLPLPLMPRRMSSVGNMSFEDAVFAPVESSNKIERGGNETEVPSKTYDEIFDTMSSYEDLKFLIKELRRWSGGKQLHACFGMNKNCTVVPPNSWPSTRRSAFVQWTTTYFGFCHKCCGGSVSYLQTSESKAKQIQKDLEKALLEYKGSCRNNGSKRYPPGGAKNENAFTPLPMSSIKISKFESTPKFTPMSVGLHSVSLLNTGDDIVEDLADDLKSLHIFKPPLNTPLARMVTLPDEASNSTTSKQKPPRLSCDDSFMDTKDFVSHMHGISPQFHSTKTAKSAPLGLPPRQFTTGSSPAIPIITAALSFDQAETPGVHKLNHRRWGSRPIAGKDWGESEQCDEKIIEALLLEAEELCSTNVANIDMDSNATLSFCHVRPGMSCVRANSLSLGIEFEASNQLQDHQDNFGNGHHHQNQESENDEFRDKYQSSKLKDDVVSPEKMYRRRVKSFAKRNRMSICHSALNSRRETFRGASLQNRMSFAQDLHFIEERVPELSIAVEEDTSKKHEIDMACQTVFSDTVKLLPEILSYLHQRELQRTASLVCTKWADAATDTLASLMFVSVGCSVGEDDGIDLCENDDIVSLDEKQVYPCSIAKSMQRSWDYMSTHYPWGAYVAEGTFKRVFRVWNNAARAEEAISVMDVDKIHDRNVVGNELAISVMLSSLTIRHVCPNFLKIREVFTSEYEPPQSHWGCAENKQPLGKCYDPAFIRRKRKPRQPNVHEKGNFQYIRMELCKYGDVEEYIKEQPKKLIPPDQARCLLFQMAYSLHVAGDRFGLKHYDIKLLNFFLQTANDVDIDKKKISYTVLRYGLGAHVFNLKMETSKALVVKLADFGTANTRPESNGQPVMLNNFTTLENTPPDFLILGDAAVQGYGHDSFGLGLCMLHLFTGDAPYEEILESVKCPVNFRKKLKRIWEVKGRNNHGYSVIYSVITLDVYEDEMGNLEGDVDETLYDTLYRFLVLFGIPEEKFQWKEGAKVWNAISSCLEAENERSPNKVRRSRRNNNVLEKRDLSKGGLDLLQFKEDRARFSLHYGTDNRIARARSSLRNMDGGMELLMSLISFDPKKRASALDVINSKFMSVLREEGGVVPSVNDCDFVHSFMSYLAIQK